MQEFHRNITKFDVNGKEKTHKDETPLKMVFPVLTTNVKITQL